MYHRAITMYVLRVIITITTHGHHRGYPSVQTYRGHTWSVQSVWLCPKLYLSARQTHTNHTAHS